MEQIDPQNLQDRLQWEQQDYWLHIESGSPLEKYPAKQHAERVAQKLGVSEGLIYLAGAPLTLEVDSDMPRPFRQLRYFYYMSGCNESDCHVTYDINANELTLFIPKIDPTRVIWNGRGSTPAEAYDKYDIDSVRFTDSLVSYLRKWSVSHSGRVYILNHVPSIIYASVNRADVDPTSLQPAIGAARMVKDDYEISMIRKANDISSKAHHQVLSNILRFKNEAQVEGLFLDVCISEGAKSQAYAPIAGSGVNAGTLHYVKNDEPLEGRQLICLDAGCEWDCYASDITRTFPCSTGTWPSKESKQIYDLVQDMQETCIKRLGPGVRYLDLHILAHYIAIDGLLALGILHNGSRDEIYLAGTSRAFFPHGLGHHIGLEVHDIGQVDLMSAIARLETESQPKAKFSSTHHLPVYHPSTCLSPVDPTSTGLEEGMVVTVEPGIYFSSYSLKMFYLSDPVHSKFINREVLLRYMPVGGVRIEDDILITATGHENLSSAPKGDDMLRIIRSQLPHPKEDNKVEETKKPGLDTVTQIVDTDQANRLADGLWSRSLTLYANFQARGAPSSVMQTMAQVDRAPTVPPAACEGLQPEGQMHGPVSRSTWANSLSRLSPMKPGYKSPLAANPYALHLERGGTIDSRNGLISERAQKATAMAPLVPQKPIAYRHSLPSLRSVVNVDNQTPSHMTSTTSAHKDSSSASRNRSRPRAQQIRPQLLSDITEYPDLSSRPNQSYPPLPTQQDSQSRYKTWGTVRQRMDADPPAIPQWFRNELASLLDRFPGADFEPVMLFKAVHPTTGNAYDPPNHEPYLPKKNMWVRYVPWIRCKVCGARFPLSTKEFEIHTSQECYVLAMREMVSKKKEEAELNVRMQQAAESEEEQRRGMFAMARSNALKMEGDRRIERLKELEELKMLEGLLFADEMERLGKTA